MFKVDPPARLVEAERMLVECRKASSMLGQATYRAPVTAVCKRLTAFVELHHRAAKAYGETVGSTLGASLKGEAKMKAKARSRDLMPSTNAVLEERALVADEMATIHRQVRAAVAAPLKGEAAKLGPQLAKSFQTLDDAIAKAEAESRLPPGLRAADAKTQTAELMKLGVIGESLKGLDPSELLRTWDDLVTVGDAARMRMAAHRLKPLCRAIVRKGAAGWKKDHGARTDQGTADREVLSAARLVNMIEHWEREQEPPTLQLARDLRDQLRHVFKMLAGLDHAAMSPERFRAMYLGSGAAADKPYRLEDPALVVTRFLPARLA